MLTKKTIFATTGTVLALALSACGSSGSNEAAPEETIANNPTISVAETTTGNDIKFKVNPGDLGAGQQVHVSVYGGGFGTDPIDCATEEVQGADITTGQNETEGTIHVREPGNYAVVMSTDGYASSCDNPNAQTTVKTEPQVFLDGDLSSDSSSIRYVENGKPFELAVILKSAKLENTELPVTLNVYGPYSTEPEMRSDVCTGNKLNSSQEIQWTGENTNRAGNQYTVVSQTIDGTKGLYVVKAELKETAEVAAAETQCDNNQSVLRVSTRDKDANSASTNPSPMATGDSNALTGNANQ